ncbi:hypothetical protein QJS10_CPB18g01049 [Acorus calamus]|uniref:RCC1-like domain-containing protein n=1 Tax=Acorus calamus TaxID=4465 RepID=A0AAV9CM90_ACOCL|nr:hypothetical protein QJS10_CPB18g01049 [Acorus calamus]
MDGQLGYSGENSPVPRLMDCFLELGTPNSPREDSHTENEYTPLKITTVKAGGMMSLAIDSLGALWMWGNCPNKGDAEEFCLASSPSPLPIWDFHGHTVVKVTCGNEHVIALVTYGETFTGGDDNLSCYSWGNNNHGQLGLGDNISRARPSIISAFDRTSSWAVYEISCGAFHTAVLARNEIGETMCWTFGFGENGQLGIGTTNNAYSPEPVESLPREAMLVSIDCGLFHTCVVSDDGCVWSWGMEKGLGLCPDATSQAGDALSPLRIKPSGIDRSPRFVLPIEVGCGAAHTVLVDDRGYKLWAWGRGRSGVLGTGQMEDSFVPCLVTWPPSSGDGGQRAQGVEAEEVVLLQAKLERMERYAGLLHLCLFGKGFDERDLSRLSNDGFDMRRELEELMETSNDGELVRMDAFYRSMHREVKERLMQRRIKGIVKDCLASLAIGDRSSMG